jgi:hypothetical protein
MCLCSIGGHLCISFKNSILQHVCSKTPAGTFVQQFVVIASSYHTAPPTRCQDSFGPIHKIPRPPIVATRSWFRVDYNYTPWLRVANIRLGHFALFYFTIKNIRQPRPLQRLTILGCTFRSSRDITQSRFRQKPQNNHFTHP